MENTLENKAKFFGLYWNRQETGSDNYGEIMPDTWSDFPNNIEKQYLILKPLSSITDEDGLELGKLLGWLMPELFNKNYIKENHPEGDSLEQLELDFLRSKGYALPWMGLSVEKQIEYGWIKLKND